ncbi:hypothetical protein NDU88_010748 [Pleurodeles waltl]|uniref:Dual specificity protein phosphatase n=1 Tax=Pleurodeles waltl TaxID=8319 RepID=A0AAV7QV99_PLEWA|nr:hypothetical protein NDU88_010748 [Pleurodeles waltl]
MTERSSRGCGTPTLSELHVVLQRRVHCCQNDVDEVWPNLYLGTASAARDLDRLQCQGITHVLNVADYRCGPYHYPCVPISYYGVPANDVPTFDISQYFCETSKFIDQALKTPGGKVKVELWYSVIDIEEVLKIHYVKTKASKGSQQRVQT